MVPNEDKVLAGLAKTIEEAILKYEEYFNNLFTKMED